jgi:hypothetical protein
MKIPSSKLQTPGKLQLPNSKRELMTAGFEVWNLRIPWSLELGIWSFAA